MSKKKIESQMKVLNRINNMLSPIIEENYEMKMRLETYDNAETVIEIENEGEPKVFTSVMDYAAKIIAKEVADQYTGYQAKDLEYDDDGVNLTQEEWFEQKYDKWYEEAKVYKTMEYSALKKFIFPYVKEFYKAEVDKVKMQWVRDQK